MPNASANDDTPRLLSGGNPQIAKGDGDPPVQVWIVAAPDWKGRVGARLDALIVDVVPDVRKAVRWNSPFYGTGEGWFLSFHALNKYVKVAFFRGTSLAPMPLVTSEQAEVRYLHVGPEDLDEAAFRGWVSQAARLPGVTL